jgi:hypothetical protein
VGDARPRGEGVGTKEHRSDVPDAQGKEDDMLRRLLIPLALAVLLGTGLAPARANGPTTVYDQGHYDQPYSFTTKECAVKAKITGHTRGHYKNYNVAGSHGQAFLAHNWYRFREVWTNPANGHKAYADGHGYFREISASHVRGDLWSFLSVETGVPIRVRHTRGGEPLLVDHGRIMKRTLFDTQGDQEPGGEIVHEKVLQVQGDFPFGTGRVGFCQLVRRAVG